MIFFRRIGDLLFFVLFALLALSALMFYESVGLVDRYYGVTDWAYTQGRVVTSELAKVGSAGSSLNRSGLARVTYRYQVGNKLYLGDRFQFAVIDSAPWNRPDEILKRFPVGKEVIVYYSPDRANLSSLTTVIAPLYIRLFIMPALVVITALIWRQRRSK
jgi:hypothetical protein